MAGPTGHCQHQQRYRSLIHNRNGQNKCYHTLAMPCHTQLTSTSVSSSGSPSRVPPSPSPPSPLPTREMVCGRSLHRSRKLDLWTTQTSFIYYRRVYVLVEAPKLRVVSTGICVGLNGSSRRVPTKVP